MKGKLIATLLSVVVALAFAQPSQAGWGWGWFGHHRYVSYRFCGWRPLCYRTYVYRPRCYVVNPCPPVTCYPSYAYPCYGTYYVPSANYVQYNLPPVYAPAEAVGFGPQAVKQFMGLDRQFGLGPLVNQFQQAAPIQPPQVQPVPAQAVPVQGAADAGNVFKEVKFSNAESRQRANQYVGYGDALFQKQRFHEALQRYKTAAVSGPDLAEVFFRQGHAYVATNHFDLAAKAFKRAVSLSGDVHRDGFRLDDLYDDNKLAKTAHVETLARRALSDPTDADAFFMLGLYLHYDGQAERAKKFFQQAEKLSEADAGHVRPFTKQTADTDTLKVAGGFLR